MEICAITNIPCSYCNPVCSHRLECDICPNKKCMANFDRYCRQPYLKCDMRFYNGELRDIYLERIKNKIRR